MSRVVELPDQVYDALTNAAVADGTTPASWIAARLSTADLSTSDWLDHDFLKVYAHAADATPDLEVVRGAMAKIPGRLVDDIRAERDER